MLYLYGELVLDMTDEDLRLYHPAQISNIPQAPEKLEQALIIDDDMVYYTHVSI